MVTVSLCQHEFVLLLFLSPVHVCMSQSLWITTNQHNNNGILSLFKINRFEDWNFVRVSWCLSAYLCHRYNESTYNELERKVDSTGFKPVTLLSIRLRLTAQGFCPPHSQPSTKRSGSNIPTHIAVYQLKEMICPFPSGMLEGQPVTLSFHTRLTETGFMFPLKIHSADYFVPRQHFPWARKCPNWRCQIVSLELLWSRGYKLGLEISNFTSHLGGLQKFDYWIIYDYMTKRLHTHCWECILILIPTVEGAKSTTITATTTKWNCKSFVYWRWGHGQQIADDNIISYVNKNTHWITQHQ